MLTGSPRSGVGLWRCWRALGGPAHTATGPCPTISACDHGRVVLSRVQGTLGERLLQVIEKTIRIKGRLEIGPSQQLVQNGIRDPRFFASWHVGTPFHPSCPPKHEIPDSPPSPPPVSVSPGWVRSGNAAMTLRGARPLRSSWRRPGGGRQRRTRSEEH